MPARNGFIYHSYEIIASKDIINLKKKKTKDVIIQYEISIFLSFDMVNTIF